LLFNIDGFAIMNIIKTCTGRLCRPATCRAGKAGPYSYYFIMKSTWKSIQYALLGVIMATIFIVGIQWYKRFVNENAVLKQVIARLEADSRAAEVLVTGVNFDEEQSKTFTTIKFLEYDAFGQPLAPKYFTFSGNIIQFQSLVIRFDDIHIRNAQTLKDKSAFLFWKVFLLNGEETQEYEINALNKIPDGYKVMGLSDPFESQLWEQFWSYALDPDQKNQEGIKNAQIEAPGSMFIPGHIYTIKIEHDGGLRIDSSPIPNILKGENIPR